MTCLDLSHRPALFRSPRRSRRGLPSSLSRRSRTSFLTLASRTSTPVLERSPLPVLYPSLSRLLILVREQSRLLGRRRLSRQSIPASSFSMMFPLSLSLSLDRFLSQQPTLGLLPGRCRWFSRPGSLIPVRSTQDSRIPAKPSAVLRNRSRTTVLDLGQSQQPVLALRLLFTQTPGRDRFLSRVAEPSRSQGLGRRFALSPSPVLRASRIRRVVPTPSQTRLREPSLSRDRSRNQQFTPQQERVGSRSRARARRQTRRGIGSVLRIRISTAASRTPSSATVSGNHVLGG